MLFHNLSGVVRCLNLFFLTLGNGYHLVRCYEGCSFTMERIIYNYLVINGKLCLFTLLRTPLSYYLFVKHSPLLKFHLSHIVFTTEIWKLWVQTHSFQMQMVHLEFFQMFYVQNSSKTKPRSPHLSMKQLFSQIFWSLKKKRAT